MCGSVAPKYVGMHAAGECGTRRPAHAFSQWQWEKKGGSHICDSCMVRCIFGKGRDRCWCLDHFCEAWAAKVTPNGVEKGSIGVRMCAEKLMSLGAPRPAASSTNNVLGRRRESRSLKTDVAVQIRIMCVCT
jgi:hypothetical protein